MWIIFLHVTTKRVNFNKSLIMATEHQSSYEEILKSYPEMTLVSESPVTWQGYLIVSSLYPAGYTRCLRVKVKLVVPNYPSFYNAQISFGRHIAFLRNREFSREVKEVIKSVQTIVSFLTRLESLIVSIGYWFPTLSLWQLYYNYMFCSLNIYIIQILKLMCTTLNLQEIFYKI